MTKTLRRSLFLFVLLFLPLCHAAKSKTLGFDNDSFTVVTYNLQTDDDMENEQQTEKFLHDNAKGLKEIMQTKPDVVNLQEVPLGGIQWIEKNVGNDYQIVYAAKRIADSLSKRNSHLVILYKKSRFEAIENPNHNPLIKTRYYTDNSGNLFLVAALKDRNTGLPISFVNTHIKNPHIQYKSFFNKKIAEKSAIKAEKKSADQAAEIVSLLQQFSFAVVSGDFNGTVNDDRMLEFTAYGYIHDPVTDATFPSNNSKLDHVLFKGSGRSKFLSDLCSVKTNIKGSDHYPLSCRIYLQ